MPGEVWVVEVGWSATFSVRGTVESCVSSSEGDGGFLQPLANSSSRRHRSSTHVPASCLRVNAYPIVAATVAMPQNTKLKSLIGNISSS